MKSNLDKALDAHELHAVDTPRSLFPNFTHHTSNFSEVLLFSGHSPALLRFLVYREILWPTIAHI